MKKIYLLFSLFSIYALAQENKNTGINTTNPRATLEVQTNATNATETATTNEGIIAPRLSKTRIANITTPVEGTLVYVTDDAASPISSYTDNNIKVENITQEGYYYYKEDALEATNSKWVRMVTQYSAGDGIDPLETNSVIQAQGLERVTEDGKTGWRLIGQDPADHSNIGTGAIDMSHSNHDTSIALGDYSFTVGSTGLASGKNSFAVSGAAFGDNSISFLGIANGNSSIALIGAKSNGVGSIAALPFAEANGISSFALGDYSLTGEEATFSMALEGAQVNSFNSFAFGRSTTINENASNSVAFTGGTANGYHSFALGGETGEAGKYAVALYGATANGQSSFAFGDDAIANGENSFAFGRYSTANGEYSFAFGGVTGVTGNNAIALSGATANGEYSFALSGVTGVTGNYAVALSGGTANGQSSFAFGFTAIANAFESVAFGRSSITGENAERALAMMGGKANGYGSIALGVDAIAMGEGSIALLGGESTNALEIALGNNFSTDTTPDIDGSNLLDLTKQLFAIGYRKPDINGRIKSANAIVTLRNGSTGIGLLTDTANPGNSKPTEMLDVNGNVRVRNVNDNEGAATDKVVVTDADGVLKSVERSTFVPAPYTAGAGIKIASNKISRTGLEVVTNNSKSGYRFIGRSADNYGDIGAGAVDLSYSTQASNEYGATGYISTAMGLHTIASGPRSLATGRETIASGSESFASGYQNVASGVRSFVIGTGNTASANNAIATGYQTTASANEAMAMGEFSTASGLRSIASGYNSLALGINSFATGYETETQGAQSFAIGYKTKALGHSSFAAGQNAEARGSITFSFGRGTIASKIYSTVFGFGNTESQSTYSDDTYNPIYNRRLFVLGNGSTVVDASDIITGVDVRSDALSVLTNAKVGINIDNFELTQSAAKLQVNGKVLIGNFGDNSTNDNSISSAPNTDASLNVLGDIKVGSNGISCNNTNRGSIKYENDNFYGCKSTGWVLLNQ